MGIVGRLHERFVWACACVRAGMCGCVGVFRFVSICCALEVQNVGWWVLCSGVGCCVASLLVGSYVRARLVFSWTLVRVASVVVDLLVACCSCSGGYSRRNQNRGPVRCCWRSPAVIGPSVPCCPWIPLAMGLKHGPINIHLWWNPGRAAAPEKLGRFGVRRVRVRGTSMSCGTVAWKRAARYRPQASSNPQASSSLF